MSAQLSPIRRWLRNRRLLRTLRQHTLQSRQALKLLAGQLEERGAAEIARALEISAKPLLREAAARCGYDCHLRSMFRLRTAEMVLDARAAQFALGSAADSRFGPEALDSLLSICRLWAESETEPVIREDSIDLARLRNDTRELIEEACSKIDAAAVAKVPQGAVAEVYKALCGNLLELALGFRIASGDLDLAARALAVSLLLERHPIDDPAVGALAERIEQQVKPLRTNLRLSTQLPYLFSDDAA